MKVNYSFEQVAVGQEFFSSDKVTKFRKRSSRTADLLTNLGKQWFYFSLAERVYVEV